MTVPELICRFPFRVTARHSSPRPPDLAGELARAVDLAQAFEDRPAVHGDRAVAARVEPEGAAERMDVAVEDEADDLARAVGHRAARVAADDVVGGDEVEALREIQPALRRVP